MSASVRIIKDTKGAGLKALNKRLPDEGDVWVGVPSGATEADGTPIAVIARAHEFGVLGDDGSVRLPERSFLRAGVRKNWPQLKRLNARNLALVARGAMSVQNALGQLGAVAAGGIKQFIRAGDFEPLKPETIARKGSSAILVDTANMEQSITWQVGTPGSAASVPVRGGA